MKRQRDEDIVDLLSDSDGNFDSGSEIEIVDIHSDANKKRVREEDLDYEEPASFDIQAVTHFDAAEIDSEPEYNEGEDFVESDFEETETRSFPRRQSRRPNSHAQVENGGEHRQDELEQQHEESASPANHIPQSDSTSNLAHIASNSPSIQPQIHSNGSSNVPPVESTSEPANTQSESPVVESNASGAPDVSPASSNSPKSEASSTTSNPSASTSAAVNRSLDVTLISIVPQKEFRKNVQWLSRAPFYRLISDFKEPVVIVFNGELLKPYFVADKVAPGKSTMDIIVLTKRQYQDVLLGDDPRAKFAFIVSGEKEEEKDDGAEEEVEDDAFPIKLEGSKGPVRVMVTAKTQCKQLCDHYMKVKGTSSARIKFEGDVMGNNDTVEDMDLEADDMLDVIS